MDDGTSLPSTTTGLRLCHGLGVGVLLKRGFIARPFHPDWTQDASTSLSVTALLLKLHVLSVLILVIADTRMHLSIEKW